MSSSYSCEEKLKKLADDLHSKAYELEQAAKVLHTLRNSEDLECSIKSAKKWAKDWMI